MKEKHIKNSFNIIADAVLHAPGLQSYALADLRPTQITAGLREVEDKRNTLRTLAREPAELQKYLIHRPIQIVLGPQNGAYVVDRHHLALALMAEGYTTGLVHIYADLSHCTKKEFWQQMQERKLIHLKNEKGEEQPVIALPAHLAGLKDDPYRSLAAAVRDKEGFQKVETPYAEFLWADFYRARIPALLVADDYNKAVKEAMKLAKDPAAAALPGYKGSSRASAPHMLKKD